MKKFQEMAEEWWFEKKYDMVRERLGFPALRVNILQHHYLVIKMWLRKPKKSNSISRVCLFCFLVDGAVVQNILFEMTKQKTVPNVFVNKTHVGGCDSTKKAYESGYLQELLAGIKYDYDVIVIGGGSGGLASAKVRTWVLQYGSRSYDSMWITNQNISDFKLSEN